MSDSPLLVTCGLPYTNGHCHIGHLRTYVPADFYVRYLRHTGKEVVFICGSDNHGTPIVISADQSGKTPREISEIYHTHFDQTFQRMNVMFDRFGMTDDPTNHQRAQKIVQSLIDNGHVYQKTISQSYCPHCKMFLPDRYVEGTCPHCGAHARGDECDQGCGKHLEPGEIMEPVCKVCGGKAELRDQEHYFFKLGDFSEFLQEYLPTLDGTSNARNYAMGWLKEGLHDWCITRTLDWGVKFPGHDDLVVYVWVDAPIGYMAFTEEWAGENNGNWEQFWRGDKPIVHFIGQDIIYHHCVFWPAILKGAGYATPDAVVASGMVKINDKTFSKSRGYVIWTNDDYLDQGLPADYLRYYLLAYTSHTKELNFSWDIFQERINNELVDTLGNFLYRTLHFAANKLGSIPEGEAGSEVCERIEQTLDTVADEMERYEFKNAIDAMMALASYGNSYIQNNAPWKLIKEDRKAAESVILNSLQIAKACTLLFDALLPEEAQKSWEMLGYTDSIATHSIAEATEGFAHNNLPKPSILFAKIEDETRDALNEIMKTRIEEAEMSKNTKISGNTDMTENTEIQTEERITIDEFARVEMKVAKVLSAEKIEGSKKLLKIQVTLGDEERQIVSGIAQFYTPEELVGKSVVVVTNLKKAKLFGVESDGMILAAGDNASLLIPNEDVLPGTEIL